MRAHAKKSLRNLPDNTGEVKRISNLVFFSFCETNCERSLTLMKSALTPNVDTQRASQGEWLWFMWLSTPAQMRRAHKLWFRESLIVRSRFYTHATTLIPLSSILCGFQEHIKVIKLNFLLRVPWIDSRWVYMSECVLSDYEANTFSDGQSQKR